MEWPVPSDLTAIDAEPYEGWKLCPKLADKEICFVVERYREGNVERLVHEHIPAFRISDEARLSLLRALVIASARRTDDDLPSIVSYYLNGRGRNPIRRTLPVRVEYPEVGVFRTYCGTSIVAWSDQVVAPTRFRQA